MADKPEVSESGLRRLIVAKIKRTLRNALDAWWVLLIIVAYSVFAHIFLGTSCLFASTTGIPCPGCGVTRAFFALLDGHLMESLQLHPLMIPSAVYICVYAVLWLVCEKMPRFMEKILIILTVALLGLYAARMLLMFPRETPMVYNKQAVLPRIVSLILQLVSA